MSEYKPYINLAKEIAEKAGEIMLHYFESQHNEVNLKPDKTVVSTADLEINQMVIDEVKAVYPEHDIFGEEDQVMSDSDYLWVCDPIDGTNPFIRGLPISVFSLALFIKRKPVVAVVNYPFAKRLYSAVSGEGAFMNGQPIAVSTVTTLDNQCVINHEWWPAAKYDVAKVAYDISKKTGAYNLSLGSCIHSACLVASGKYEASLFAGSTNQIVDIAAAKLLIEEAGGKVTDIYGDEDNVGENNIKGCVMTNGSVHGEVMSYFKKT